MKENQTRILTRIAALQDYSNRPWQLKGLIAEVATKGYQMVMVAAFFGDEPYLEDLCAEARKYNLEVMAFTGFQKYNAAWLKVHPDQTMVFNTEVGSLDQDRLGVFWGCPFNPDFQAKYFEFLGIIGRIPNVSEVLINDEAYIGDGPEHLACYCKHCRADWRQDFGTEMPLPPFTDLSLKAKFIDWRFRRWNEAHSKMKDALNHHHPVKAIFQASPVCCLEFNPWVSGVDLSGMIEKIDGVMTDPYYTFHLAWGAGPYNPLEIYLSETSRYLYGLASHGKTLEMCVQGFSHPTFVRPLDDRDGWWSRVVPLALGIDGIMAYTYTLQKTSPVQKTYEASFRLDSYFAKVKPVDYVAIIDSVETQAFHVDANLATDRGDSTWHYGYLMKIGELCRHRGLSYVYLPGRKLTTENLSRWPVIALPGVSCLSKEARGILKDYVRQGGTLLAFGETATRNEVGQPLADDFLAEVFGIRDLMAKDDNREFNATRENQWAFSNVEWPDDTTAGYMGGAMMPVMMLKHCVEVKSDPTVQRIAEFNDQTGPAITIKSYGQGHGVFLGGLPTRTAKNPWFGTNVLNHAGLVVGNIIDRLAGSKNPVRVTGFPLVSPIHQLRPLDPRRIPTVEILACAGEDYSLVAIPSYFKETFGFDIIVQVPIGKKVREVRELITEKSVPVTKTADGEIKLSIHLGHDDFLTVLAIFWDKE